LIVGLATGKSAVEAVSHGFFDYRGSQHLPNVFRLPPSDDKVQAPGIAYFVSTLGAKDAHLVEGVQENAERYSVPLCDEIGKILHADGIKVGKSRTTPDLTSIVDHIRANHGEGDVVVFCGYKREASDFLSKITAAYASTAPKDRPTLVFSDATEQRELASSTGSFTVYRSGPLDIHKCIDQKMLTELEKNAKTVDRPLTPEQIHGYDSVQLLWTAAEKCAGRLSRRCLLDELNSGRSFPSICADYAFRDGENLISNYYIFGVPENNSTQVLTPPQILHMLTLMDSSHAAGDYEKR
jgi:ABC-type branched-subunit amino acid transport system substrate-binding protein